MRRSLISLCIILLPALFVTGCVEPKEDPNNNPGLCGNGEIDVGEECDDGNTFSHDGCSELCKIEPFCGNGVVEPGEECDDHNADNGDGCSRTCEVENGCGDGVLQVGEECDDDNVDSGDGCDSECNLEGAPVCGNGVHEYTEGCDDGNTDDGDGCSSTCVQENGCGDGELTAPEQCDDGNGISGDGCSKDCLVEFICGNNDCATQEGETCELCPSDCCPSCGDGVLDEGEECDDGGNTSGDGCSRGCADEDGSSDCGNGLWEVGEECDDGNDVAHDGCSPTCEREYECGDGACDVHEGESCEACRVDCCPACGNGIRQSGEQCDGDQLNGKTCEMFGYSGGQLSCTTYCDYNYTGCTGTGPVCGNGVKEYGEECDGTDLGGEDCISLGFVSGITFCDGACRLNTSGCVNQVRWYYESFDDLLAPPLWQFSYPYEWGKPVDAGPSAAFSGENCVGTNLSGNAPDNADYTSTWFVTPPIDLSEATAPVLYFWAWFSMETSTYDYDEWRVEYSTDGSTWTVLTTFDPPYNGTNAYEMYDGADAWNPYLATIDTLAGESTVFFRFSTQFDHYGDFAGVYIDDVMVVEGAYVPITFTTAGELGKAVVGYPFSRQLNVWGGSGDLTYSVVGTLPSWLSLNPTTGQLSGTPAIGDLGNVNVTIRAIDNQNPVNTVQKDFTIEVVDGIYFEDFENGSLPTGWIITGSIFEYGSATGTGSPSGCYSGSYCMGTDMNAEYPNYMDFADNCIISGTIDLTSANAAVLTFKGWRDTETNYDGAICEIEINGSGTWDDSSTHTPVYNEDNGGRMTWSGTQATWEDFEVDLSPYLGNDVKIRWCFYSDVSNTGGGWFIDDVMVLGN